MPASATASRRCLLILSKQPDANIIETVDRVRAHAAAACGLRFRSPSTCRCPWTARRTIRASLREVERTLWISIGLVVLVVFLFLRNVRAALIPTIAVPVSLIGTFGVMYLAGYSLNNLSLMALTIATGFVVDDAIVVLENISRHIEKGMPPFQAAHQGAREVGFTVLSMSLSLIAVFIPILLMGGIVGRLFREFAVTLSAAIMISLVVSLTTTPMMCARWLARAEDRRHGRLYHWSERQFDRLLAGYERTLRWALRPRAADDGAAAGRDLPECLSLRNRAQGLLSAAGHRPAGRRPSRPTRAFRSRRHAAEADRFLRDRAQGAGCGERGRLHRRRQRIPGSCSLPSSRSRNAN